MTQANESNSRIERLEALMLEIAAANLRHDRDIDQNNTAIARHDEEFSRINVALEQSAARHDEEFSRINAALEQSAARHDEEFSRINNAIEQLTIQQREAQAETRASINDLVSMIGTLGQNADRHWEVIQRHWEAVQEMQAEVRGLQTENRRILERLEQHTSNGHGDQ